MAEIAETAGEGDARDRRLVSAVAQHLFGVFQANALDEIHWCVAPVLLEGVKQAARARAPNNGKSLDGYRLISVRFDIFFDAPYLPLRRTARLIAQ